MNRRSLLQAFTFAPITLATVSPVYTQQKLPGLTVEDVEVFRIKVNKRGNWTIVRLNTSGGVTVLGYASQSGHDEQVLNYIRQFSSLLRGQSIFAVEWFRRATAPVIAQHGAAAAVAASALEQSLWDIQGKAFSVPTYDLFGGRIQDRIRIYANINRSPPASTQ
jgi:galactonate dehydratase